jgi:oxygen-independent coproporphyrinogen-3 oxidase
LSKCPYCDFFSVADNGAIPHDLYANAVIAEFDRRIQVLEPAAQSSLYFGGGTPSLWNKAALGRVVSHVRSVLGCEARTVEVTLECNPGSFDCVSCSDWQNLGINRLSVGLQSLNNSDLEYLGRVHDANSGLAALVDALESGMPKVCADIIFGLPGRSPEDTVNELKQLPLAELSHLSAYALTVEPNTPFGALARAGKLPIAPDDVIADTFIALHEAITSAKFEHYEISNFAKPGHRSVHNMGYWKGHDYLGLGAAAWGTVTGGKGQDVLPEGQRLRYRNTSSVRRYLDSSSRADALWQPQPKGMLADRELIDSATALTERLMLGLRTREGINLDVLAREFDIAPWLTKQEDTIGRLIQQGRLNQDGSNLSIPFDAWFVADGTISELI